MGAPPSSTGFDIEKVVPIQIKFANRTCFTGALVIGESVLMGAVPMEDMDLVVSPSGQSVTLNPQESEYSLSRGEVRALPQR